MDARLTAEILQGIAPLLGAGLTVGGYAYAAQWPASRLFGHGLDPAQDPDQLSFTFDDGPNLRWTPRMMELLAKHGATGTFFMVGKRAVAEPNLVREVRAAGHIVGCHSWDHPNLAYVSLQRAAEEVTRSRRALEQILGEPVRFFRPPFGAHGPLLFKMARQMGLEPVLWNAMTSDWSNPSSQWIADKLSGKIERNSRHGRATIVVLHDGNHADPEADRAPSAGALELLLEKYQGRKKFVPLTQWMLD